MTGAVVHSNPWFAVTHRRTDRSDWYRIVTTDSAMVVAEHPDGSLLMIRGERDTVPGGEFYEFPCGGVEPGEAPARAAARETREETGWSVGHLTELGTYVQSPGICAAVCHVYSTVLNIADHGEPDPEEPWTPVFAAPRDVRDLIRRGLIRDAGTLAALSMHDAANPER